MTFPLFNAVMQSREKGSRGVDSQHFRVLMRGGVVRNQSQSLISNKSDDDLCGDYGGGISKQRPTISYALSKCAPHLSDHSKNHPVAPYNLI